MELAAENKAEFTGRMSSEASQVHGIGATRKKGGMKVQPSKKTGQQMARKPQGKTECHPCGGKRMTRKNAVSRKPGVLLV